MTAAMNQVIDKPANSDSAQLSAESLSRQQPAWHVVALCVLTCQAYPFYWFYKTWRDLSQQAALPENSQLEALRPFAGVSPLLRSIGLLIPIWHLYLAFGLIKGIASLYPKSNSFPVAHPRITGALVLLAISALLSLSALPGSLYLLSFTAFVPLALAQHWLNAYWAKVESKDLIVRHAFSGLELAAIILGSLWLGLILASFWLLPVGTAGGAH